MFREVEVASCVSSTTVSVTVYDPDSTYAWTGVMPDPVLASPKSHVYLTIVPSESEERDALNVTSSPGATTVALAVKEAAGARRDATETVVEAVEVKSSVS